MKGKEKNAEKRCGPTGEMKKEEEEKKRKNKEKERRMIVLSVCGNTVD